MKIFVASDIHGSAYWAQKITEAFNKSGADALVLLGDIYNHGPRNPFPRDYAPMKVAEILSAVSAETVAVRGNCDSDVDAMISAFPFVDNNVMFVGGRRVFFTHGHVYNGDSLPKLAQGDVLVYGHFHISRIAVKGGVICVNVGSASLPKDASTYCIIDDGGVTLYDFDGNIAAQHNFTD